MQTIVVRGNYYNLTGMLYRCWFQKIVTACRLLLNISPLSNAPGLPKWHKFTGLHKTCSSHLLILSVFESLWQILSSFIRTTVICKPDKCKRKQAIYHSISNKYISD